MIEMNKPYSGGVTVIVLASLFRPISELSGLCNLLGKKQTHRCLHSVPNTQIELNVIFAIRAPKLWE